MSPGEGKVPPWVQPLGPTLFSKIFVIHLIPPPKRQPIPGVQTVQHRRQTDEVEKRRETRTTRRRRLCPCPSLPSFLPCFSIVLSVYDSASSNHMETWNRLPKMALLYYGDPFLQHFSWTYPNLVDVSFRKLGWAGAPPMGTRLDLPWMAGVRPY